MIQKLVGILNGTRSRDPLERRNAHVLQAVCAVIFVPTVVAELIRAVTASPSWRADYVMSSVANACFMVSAAFAWRLARTGRVNAGVAVLAWTVTSVFVGDMVVFGLHHFLGPMVSFASIFAIVALLLGRRALWAVFVTLVSGMALGALREAGMLGPPPVVPAHVPTFGAGGQLLLGFLMLVLVLDQFGTALRTAYRDSEERRRQIEEAAADLAVQTERRLRAQAALADAQRFEAIGHLAGGVAHDVNNSLTVALASAELICADRQTLPAQRELAEAICDACNGAAGLTRQLLALGRRDVSDAQLVEPRSAIDGMDRLLRSTVGRSGISTVIDSAAGLPHVWVDPSQLRQVLLNLAINARDAMPRGGELRFEIEGGPIPPAYSVVSRDVGPEAAVRIHVHDTGEGIADEILPRVLEPFFTTKAPGKGTGLGLSLARAFAEESGGRIGVRSRLGSGTTVSIELPGVPVSSRRPVAHNSAIGGKRVLVVDDDPRVRSLIIALLEAGGHTTISAESGEAAIPLLTDPDVAIDLLFTDVIMPGMGGEGLVQAFREARPKTPILVCSGYVRDSELRAWIEREHITVLHKPFSPAELRARVTAALDGERTARR